MSKYNRELKCIIAKQYLDGTSSLYLAKQYSISSRQIRYRAQVFTIHGANSFLSTKSEKSPLSNWMRVGKLGITTISSKVCIANNTKQVSY